MIKPEHVFQPGRFLSRYVRPVDKRSPTAMTSFGLELDVMPNEMISNSIRRNGMFDIVTAEVLYRLLDPGAHAIDVGGNIGLMSVVMALRVGGTGRVVSLEPHPDIYPKLAANAGRANRAVGSDTLVPRQIAASRAGGHQALLIGDDWAGNAGAASLSAVSGSGTVARRVEVECVALDGLLGPAFAPSVMKLDVEGHELPALEGAPRMLRGLRDILFEDHHGMGSPVMRLLEDAGFRIFAIWRTVFGPRIASADRGGLPRGADPNYLATRNLERARERIQPRGWRVLRPLAAR